MSASEEHTNGHAPISSNEFFETIGKKAGHLAPASNDTNGTNGTNGVHENKIDDEKVVEEIESLCMNCHENVSNIISCLRTLSLLFVILIANDYIGHNTHASNGHSLLPRSYHHVVQLRQVRFQ